MKLKSKFNYIIRVIGRTVPRNNTSRCLFIVILLLHVSALVGHLQAEFVYIYIYIYNLIKVLMKMILVKNQDRLSVGRLNYQNPY
jgi:hypothetical protein